MGINWKLEKGKRFLLGKNYMAEVADWCRNNIDPNNWAHIQFDEFLYVRLYDTNDVIIFKLRFATMYKEVVVGGSSNGN
jgi:hypothetical protein